MSPAALRARLGSALEFSARVIDTPERQHTLRSTIEWSYSVLGPELQRAFRRVGVFAGPFDLAAVNAVVTEHDGSGDRVVAEADPLEVIGDLVDASGVRLAEGADSEPRFRVLQTIAAFARDKLAEHGELDDIGRRHAQHCLVVVEAMSTGRDGATDLLARRRIETELDHLRAALGWRWAIRPNRSRAWMRHPAVTTARRWVCTCAGRCRGSGTSAAISPKDVGGCRARSSWPAPTAVTS